MKKILKKIIPEYVIWKLTEKLEEFRIVKARIIKSNSLFVGISLLLSKNYICEHRSFLEGAYIYELSKKKNLKNISFLRRNIHRLEKGMIMKPRRGEFGVRFILQTVRSFKAYVESSELKGSEYVWAYQVLREYFRIVKSNNINYRNALDLFNGIEFEIDENIERKIPLKPSDISLIRYQDFHDLNSSRYSVRWFKEKNVQDEILEKALSVAVLSPSSCNRSPYRYVISNKEPSLTEEIARVSSGTDGWAQNIPCIAVLVGKQSAFSNVSNRHSIYVDSTLSVMPFVLALKTMGVSTCLINWADIPSNEDRMRKLLSLTSDEKIIISIAIGYQDDDSLVPYSQKKNVSEISNFI